MHNEFAHARPSCTLCFCSDPLVGFHATIDDEVYGPLLLCSYTDECPRDPKDHSYRHGCVLRDRRAARRAGTSRQARPCRSRNSTASALSPPRRCMRSESLRAPNSKSRALRFSSATLGKRGPGIMPLLVARMTGLSNPTARESHAGPRQNLPRTVPHGAPCTGR